MRTRAGLALVGFGLALVAGLGGLAAAAAAPPDAALLVWSAQRPLAVADFRANPDPASPYEAHITSYIQASGGCYEGEFSERVEAVFDRNASWCRHPGTASAALLRHEQLHFDLTELYARQLRQRLIANRVEAPGDCAKSQQLFARDLAEVRAEWSLAEARYDHQSRHGNSEERQTAWEWQTRKKLAQLQAYAQ